ncbi:potassium channel family protein [Gynuella sunshinyii]|uniref:Potassium channel protein n=1 Tax=Gynuella sunshinyii YC6258 TaxID=1445510 RepID=A0A0C5UXN4_9GAMM|nr:potassium channel family protein [Gynuella sunshinyii]AJQ92070.1 hypothetical Protein YC6258_00014 [Gynuella sunshinyii YC6258]
MLVISTLKKLLMRHFMELRWHSILLVIAAYMLLSWAILWVCGEVALTRSHDFIYWLIVTASTVGYGDLSPETVAGKYAVAFLVIPMGLGLFGLTIGRVAAFVSYQWRKGIKGMKALNYDNHILVIGWNENRTLQLIRLLQHEMAQQTERQQIALCVRVEVENPMPDSIGFTRVSSFSNDADMERTSLEKASTIIIDTRDDDVTMTTALYCSSKNPQAHIIAYFNDDTLGALLKQHCPNVECMPSVAVEMIAKSAVDPGSSALHYQLLAVDEGMTQYSMKYRGQHPVTIRDLFNTFKERYEATLIGLARAGTKTLQLNPALNDQIQPGDTLYYIAEGRINHIDWENFRV